jgi:hypothetical protein
MTEYFSCACLVPLLYLNTVYGIPQKMIRMSMSAVANRPPVTKACLHQSSRRGLIRGVSDNMNQKQVRSDAWRFFLLYVGGYERSGPVR